MKKVRIYELAKEMGLTSKELIGKLKELDIEVGNHMSTLDQETVDIIKEIFDDTKSDVSEKPEAKEEKPEAKEEKPKAKEEKPKAKEEKPKAKERNDNTTKIKEDKKQKEGGMENMEKEENKDLNITEEDGTEDFPVIKMGDNIQVKELAEKLGVQSSEVITNLMGLGVMATVNQEVDMETASIVAAEHEYKVERESSEIENLEEILEETYNYQDDESKLEARPPIVTVMGHVDHGKTSLLDAIRETSVTNKEAGGITQHIGASTVKANGEDIVFLDTPGHEAFTAMRARGSKITDVTILVVAADDGVMPQTVEAINHAKAAGLPIIVAINKIDKPGANPDKVKQELTEHGLIPEDWGGDTIFAEVSAITRDGIEELLEMILLVAEVQELKANPSRKAIGTIIEAKLDKGRGAVATVLVQNGTLSVGDSVVIGKAYGKIRAMIDDKGKNVKKAGPSTPVEILGLSEVPESGDKMYQVENDKKARYLADKMQVEHRDMRMKEGQKVSLDNLFDTIEDGEIKDLNIIIKADVRGTIEAIKQSLLKLSTGEVRVNPIHGGVGAITESDIMLASASNAIIVGFNVRPTNGAMEVAKTENVDVRTYSIIYNAIEDIKSAMEGMLEPDFKEVVQGRAEVREIFKIPGGVAAGIYVQTGKITRNSQIRILRDNIVIYEGELSSLRRFKDNVKEIATGYEGGLSIEGFKDMKENDVIEAYIMEEVKREL